MTIVTWGGYTFDTEQLKGRGFQQPYEIDGVKYEYETAMRVAALKQTAEHVDATAEGATTATDAAAGAAASLRALGSVVDLVWDPAIGAADPGGGKVRANARPDAATYLYISDTDAAGASIAARVGTWGSSTSSFRGDLFLRSADNAAVALSYVVVGPVYAAVGYLQVPVLWVGDATVDDGALPTTGSAVKLSFQRAGSKGDSGDAGTPASEGVAGVAKISPQTLVDEGLDDATFITPLKAARRFISHVLGTISIVLTFGKAVRGSVVNVVWEPTITLDLNAGNIFYVTLAGPTTFANPTIDPAIVGQWFTVIPKQDPTGSRTGAFGSFWKPKGGTHVTLTTTPGKSDHLYCYAYSTTEIHYSNSLGF